MMTTHQIPQRENAGSSKGWPWLPIVLGLLTMIVVAVLVWQVYEYTAAPPIPTRISQATVPALTRVPSLEIVPTEGAAGASITVVGWGWQPDDDLIVCLDDLGSDAEPPVYAETTVREDGGFTASFTFPEAVQWLSLPDIPVVVESKTGPEKASAVFRLVLDTPAPSPTPTTPPASTATPLPTAVPPTATPACVYAMRFVADVTIPDDTVIPPGVGFVKTWRILNSGTCAWPAGTNWVFAGGSQLGGPYAVPVPAANPGETADVSVYLIAPNTPGPYTGYWTVRLPDGTTLSRRAFVRIVVPAPTPTATPVPPTPVPTLAPTPVIYNWHGEYFSNTTLAGAPALVRDDTAVDFNWGMGAPAAGIPADNFSVRWTRSLYFEGGNYRFYAHSDDGVRLWIDNTLVLDEWHSASAETHMTVLALSTGNHLIRVEYYEALGTAQIQLWWQRIDYYPDWRGEYWSNRSLSGPSALLRNDTAIDFNWGRGAPATTLPADNFSVRWTRILDFEPGTYRLYARADDGVRVYVDGQRVLDHWHLSGADRTYQTDVALHGTHTIVVEYYEDHLGAEVHFWYERVGNLPAP